MGYARLPAIIFDCDGVLVDSEYLASRVEAEVTRDLGLDLTADEAHDLFLGKTVDGVFELIASRSEKPPPPSFVYEWAFATAHAFMRELAPVADVQVALAEFARRGYPMAVASQSPLSRVRLSLQVTGLERWFGDHVYVSSMVQRPKPAPDLYLFAARKLGQAPADCLVIEDSPSGAAAALAAGFRVVGYAPGAAAAAMRVAGVEVIESMREVISLAGSSG